MIVEIIVVACAAVSMVGFDIALVNVPSLARVFNLTEMMEEGITIGRVNADLSALASRIRKTHNCELGRVLVADYPFAPVSGCNGTATFPIIVEKFFRARGARLDVGCLWSNCTNIPGSEALEVCTCTWGDNGTGISLLAALAPLECSGVLDTARVGRVKREPVTVIVLAIIALIAAAGLVVGSLSMKGVRDLAAATSSDLDSMVSLIHSSIYSESTATKYFDCDSDGKCNFNGHVGDFVKAYEGDWFSGIFAGFGAWIQSTFGLVWYYVKWVAIGAGAVVAAYITYQVLTCICIPAIKAARRLKKKRQSALFEETEALL